MNEQNQTIVIEPYTNRLVREEVFDIAVNSHALIFDDDSDTYAEYVELTDAIYEKISQEPWSEQMLFAHNLTEEYNLGAAFPSEQRMEALGEGDWRHAAVAGIWHLIHKSLMREAKRIKEKYDNPGDDHSWIQQEEAELPPLQQQIEIATTEVQNLAEDMAESAEARNPTKEFSLDDPLERPFQFALNLSIPEKVILTNYLAEEYGFEEYDAMSDTAVRDVFGFLSHHMALDKIISDFRLFYDSDDSEKQSGASDKKLFR